MVFVTQTAPPQSVRTAEQKKVKAPARLVPKRQFRAVAGHGRGRGKASRMPELLCRNWSLMYILALVSVFPLLYGSLQLS